MSNLIDVAKMFEIRKSAMALLRSTQEDLAAQAAEDAKHCCDCSIEIDPIYGERCEPCDETYRRDVALEAAFDARHEERGAE